jgi:hypothetical protein
LKEALDSRTGTARRLAHLTGQVGGAARDAAQSKYVTRAATAVGAQGLQNVAAGAANKVGKLVGVSGPQSADAPAMPAVLWADAAEVDTYVAWLAHVRGAMESYGGTLAEYAGRLAGVMRKIEMRRAALRACDTQEAVRLAAYWLGYHIDLWDLPVPPHRSVLTVVNDLHSREAHALYLLVHPLFGELVESIGSLYDAGIGALAAGGSLVDAGQFQLGTLRDQVYGVLPDPRWGAEPTDADETAARDLFGRSFADIPS